MKHNAKDTESQLRQFWALLHLSAFLLFALVLGTLLNSFFGSAGYKVSNFLAPIALFVGCTAGGFFLILRNASNLWTPIVWFLLGNGLYYGVGPLFYVFGDVTSLDSIWYVGEDDLWRTHVTTLLGTSIVLISFLVCSRFFSIPKKSLVPEWVSIYRARRVLVYFLIGGIFFKYFLVIPYHFGIIKYTVPGFIANFADMMLIALALTGYLAARLGGRWWVAFGVFFVIEVFVGILTLSKTGTLYVPLFAFLGVFLAKQRMGTLVQGAVLIALMYVLIKPLIAKGRVAMYKQDFRRGAGFGKRFEFVQDAAVSIQGSEKLYSRDVGWWLRLCYVTYHGFAMAQYDGGYPGNTLKNLPYLFIPRLLWPDKPIMTLQGVEFTELIFGHRSSHTGLGLFGELYWNGGYWYIFLFSIYVGLCYTVTTFLALNFLEKRLWFYMPLVLFGIRLGFESRAWFAPTFIGFIPIYLGTLALMYGIRFLLRRSIDPY